MTIFLKILCSLVDARLIKCSNELLSQSKGYGYNVDLSLAQKKVVDELRMSICQHQGTSNDRENKDWVVSALEKALNDIREVRESYKAKESSNTVNAINTLSLKVKNFYTKLDKFGFSLLNLGCKPNEPQPEDIVYKHAASWLGEEIFEPSSTTDKHIRTEKENALRLRLENLHTVLLSASSFEERKKWSQQALDDLNADNKRVTKGKSKAVPGLNFFGMVDVTTGSLGPREGRLKNEIKQAKKEIAGMNAGSSSSSSSSFLNRDDDHDKDDDDDDDNEDNHSHHSVEMNHQ